MQLFVTEYIKKENIIVINDIDLLSQLRKVLRASIGDIIWIQNSQNENKKTRYEIRIEVWDNKILEGTIVSEQIHNITNQKRSMIIAMPNKRDKAELIVQKLTECGLDQIIFWPSERSILKEWNPNKEGRLQKIIKEAVEQSRGRTMPELLFTTNPKELVGTNPLVVFDKQTGTSKIQKSDHIYGLIGPEGGLTFRDYQTFEGTKYDTHGLGETVLRTETAAIIGGRLLKNNFKF
ncbi:MAG: RsmE family RNA methyltransferase [Candidatus Absconditabacterales bacterium]